MLRKRGVVGKFVEFFGPGLDNLTLADRATIANMAPEYGATMGFFPIDEQTIDYLKLTNRDSHKVKVVEGYLKEQGLFRTKSNPEPTFTGQVLELDLGSVEPCVSGPKRPHDRVPLKNMKKEWKEMLNAKLGFKGFAIPPERTNATHEFSYKGSKYTIKHGDIFIAAITSCTNTSNPDSLMAAALVA